jgi:DNA repair exonuclease SbcCD nuclease subunit
LSYKIALITDCHLGYSSGRRYKDGLNLRVLDGYNAWNESVDEIIKAKPDIFLMGGDIFHQAHPTIRTIIEAQKGFRRISDAGIPVYCIVGNHDATDIRSEIPASGVLNEPFHNIYSYTEPYVKKEVAPGIFIHFLSHHAYSEQAETMKKIKLEKNAINILLSHGSCFDTNLNVILHCPQEPREIVIPEDIVNLPWDFTFLGHIHERGFIGSKDGGLSDSSGRKQFYGGSILRRGFTDKPCKLGRGWTMWTIDDNKKFHPTFYKIWQRPQFDLPAIDATEKTSIEIENILVSQLDKLSKQLGPIDDSNSPIVRQTIHNISPAKYVSINWKKTTDFTKQFLTYTLRKDTLENNSDETDLDSSLVTIGKQQDIVDSFGKWAEHGNNLNDIQNKEKVIDNSKNFLKQGQESVLESN